MTRHEIACKIVSFLDNDINNVSVSEEMEEIMKRSQIIKKYGDNIKQIADGRYHIRHNGRQIFKKSFELVIDEILKRENQEDIKTLENIADDFFEYRFTNSSSGTYAKDKSNYENFIKDSELAKKDITKIVFSDGVKWSNYCLNVKKDMKEKYFKNVRGTLNQMIKFAINNNIITQNPIANVSIHKDHFVPQTKHTNNELVFEDFERKKVCKIAYEDYAESKSALPLAIPFLFQTGLRDGELCALKWKDLEQQKLHVQAEMIEDRDKDNKFLGYKYVNHTKTKAGDRLIQLNAEAINILSLIKATNLKNNYPTSQNDFIFLRTYKKEICECTTRCFETRIKKYCRKAKMNILKSQHDIRRTFATNLFYVGMNVKDIQVLMGHESLEQTMAYIKRKEANANVVNYLEMITSDIDIQSVI